jgi:Tfp pilus assembly protein PilO
LPPTNLAGLQEVPIELIVAGSIRDTVALLSQLGRTSRLLTVMDVKLRMVAVGQPRELLTTLTVAGNLLPAVGGD